MSTVTRGRLSQLIKERENVVIQDGGQVLADLIEGLVKTVQPVIEQLAAQSWETVGTKRK